MKFAKILSCSAESNTFPAINLIDGHQPYNCPKETASATVELALDEPGSFESVVICNNGSSHIELWVSNDAIKPHFKLLLKSQFMNLLESQQGKNVQKLRTFNLEDFEPGTSTKKWEQVRLVISQEYTHAADYGVKFVRFNTQSSTATDSEDGGKMLGQFLLRKDPQKSPQKLPNLFAVRKEEQEPEEANNRPSLTTITAASRKILEPPPLAQPTHVPKMEESKSAGTQSGEEYNPISQAYHRSLQVAPKLTADNLPTFTTSASSPQKRPSSPPPQDLPRKRERAEIRELSPSPPPSPEKKGTAPASAASEPKKLNFGNVRTLNSIPSATKSLDVNLSKFKRDQPPAKAPFDSLLKHCVFTISGIVGSKRDELKKMCSEMGAKITGEVSPDVTHVIGTNPDNPKSKELQARGKGKLIKPEWISQCHRERRLVPESSFVVFEARASTSPSTSPSKNSDDAALIKQVMMESLKTREHEVAIQKALETNEPGPASKSPPRSGASYTLVDNEDRRGKTMTVQETLDYLYDPQPRSSDFISDDLPSFLKHTNVHIIKLHDSSLQKRLLRYVISYGGEITKVQSDPSVTHLVTEGRWNSEIEDAIKANKRLMVVMPEWVVQCHRQQRRVEEKPFLVKRVAG